MLSAGSERKRIFYEQNINSAQKTQKTLKYYRNEGLIPNVKRDSNNRRVFDEKDVKWIRALTSDGALQKLRPTYLSCRTHKKRLEQKAAAEEVSG